MSRKKCVRKVWGLVNPNHDLQRSSISRGEYERWIVKTRNQIRGAVANRRMAVATP